MTDTANQAPQPETLQFLVGFDALEDPDCGIAGAAARELKIDLRIQSPDQINTTWPGLENSIFPFTVQPHLKWLIDTVIGEMVGYYPAPFFIELRFPCGTQPGIADITRLDHPDAPAHALSGTVVTKDLKETVQEAGRQGKNLVVVLADRYRRFLEGDYGDAAPEAVRTSQINLAANAGEVTGVYLTEALDEPNLVISQYLPYEKGAIMMLAREYNPVQYRTAAAPAD